MARLALGTRGSALALAQANWVAERLRAAHPGLVVELQTITTEGDKTQAANIPLSAFSEKGVFAKEIEAALIAGAVDLAVHSMKDLAPALPDGLQIAAVPMREDPRDAILGARLADLPAGAKVGTGSVRRSALITQLRPDLTVASIRGNVDSRIRKMQAGQYHAILLAVAGLARLARLSEIAEVFDPLEFVPDPGQGALAIQIRVGDARTNELIAALDHAASHTAIRAERAYLAALDAGCQTPVGAWARFVDDRLFLTALRVAPDGAIKRQTLDGAPEQAEDLGRRMAEILLKD